LAEFRAAVERGDREYLPIWAGESVDLITELTSASALVARIAERAEHAISTTGNTVRGLGVRH
jgi:nitronate monooxygenase